MRISLPLTGPDQRCHWFVYFLLRERFRGEALFFAARPVLLVVFRVRLGAGTLAPFFRASDRPIATACLRLVTFFSERPDVSFPFFFSCIARLTDFCAPFEYFAIMRLSFFEKIHTGIRI
jgi:hypothetical protein